MQNNRVYLQGRLCHAPRLFQTRSKRAKLVFRLAIPRPLPTGASQVAAQRRSDSSHSVRATADFITVVVLGALADELHRRHLQTGAWMSVSGWLRSWDRPSTRTHSILEVVAEQVQSPQGQAA